MSNLDAAISQATLMMPASLLSMNNPTRPKSRLQIAKRVFLLAASGGFPYTGMTHKQWAKKWLPSDSFKLMEIDINAAASPHLPKNPERVAFRLLCSTDSMDPLVVDCNKQKVGKSRLGYVPEVIVVDGKHRKQGMLLQGHQRVLAWVGCKAEKKIKNATVIKDIKFRTVPLINKPGAKPAIEASALAYVSGQKEHKFKGPLASAVAMYCAVVPSSGQTVVDQSGGESGSRPRGAVVRADSKACPRCGSTKFKLMPTDFETAKCSKCGKTFQMKAMGTGTSGGPGGSTLGTGSGMNPKTMTGMEPGIMKTTTVHAKSKLIDDCAACGPAFSEGQPEEPSSSDDPHDFPSASDQSTFVSPSDRIAYTTRPNIKAPGARGWTGMTTSDLGPKSMLTKVKPDIRKLPGKHNSVDAKGGSGAGVGGGGSPDAQSPGSGVGPRIRRSTGAKRSEMSRLADTVPTIGTTIDAKAKIIDKIWVKDKSKRHLFPNLNKRG